MKLVFSPTSMLLASSLVATSKVFVNAKDKKPQGLRHHRNADHNREERRTRYRDLDGNEGDAHVDRHSKAHQKAIRAKYGDNHQIHYVDVATSDSNKGTPVTPYAIFNHNHGNNVKNNYQTRIVGGQEADPQEYPYYVDLGGCGGSLIASRVVLSAAHCGNYVGDSVIVGGYEAGSTTQGADEITVADQADHPNYNSNTDENDFMLMLLEEDASLGYTTNVVLSLDLNGLVDTLSNGHPMTVIGLGALSENGGEPDTLREVVVPFVDDNTCSGAYGSDFVGSNMYCAGTGETDSCYGDSGGPMVVINGNNHIQTGVVSWGYTCADPNYPGVYAQISSAGSWIKSVVCDEWNVQASFCPGGPAPTPAPVPTPTQQPVTSPTAPTPTPPTPPTGNGCFRLDFEFHTDRWPEENDFFLEDDNGNRLWDEWVFSPNSLYEYTAECLDINGCYALDFWDDWEDGLESPGYIRVLIDGEEEDYMTWDIGGGVIFYLGNGC